MNKRALVAVAIAILVAAQGVAAGVAFWMREEADRRLAGAAARNAGLRRAAEDPAPAPVFEAALPQSRWRLHDGNDVPATMQLLEAICDGEGVTIDSIKAVSNNPPGRQSFVLGVRGAPEAVCSLLAALEQHDRLLVVENGRVRPGGDGAITAELGVAAVYRGDAR